MEERLGRLLKGYLDDSLTTSEEEELFDLLRSDNEEEAWVNIIEKMMAKEPAMASYDPSKWEPVVDELKRRNADRAPVVKMKSQRRFTWWAAAAAVLLIAGYIGLQTHNVQGPMADTPTPVIHDLPPGSNKAVLTTSDGSTIILDDASIGVLSKEGNTEVVKLADGQLAYKTGKDATDAISYNTMSTPRGGQYQLILPDGTAVWLNAASSITYPTAFAGDKRVVSITGEAYFEVASQMNKSGKSKLPFIVEIKDLNTSIEVLGTHFNVNAYTDELSIKTTLLEGAVKVSSAGISEKLGPGQQTQTFRDGRMKFLGKVNTKEAVAWKNGGFYFDGADIQTIMRQIERWYNVTVKFNGDIPQGHYKGQPSRNLSLSKMLQVLKYSGLKYEIEGTTITILED